MMFRFATACGLATAMLSSHAISAQATVKLPLEASDDTPWQDLADVVSSPDVLTGPTDLNQWYEQCVDPFELEEIPPEWNDFGYAVVSNYDLLNVTSGLCLDFVSCAFQNCIWPTPEGIDSFPDFPIWDFDTNQIRSPHALLPGTGDDFLAAVLSEEAEPFHNFPARVVNPRVVADIVHAVNFARTNEIGITVKVNGHSYFGSSSARKTLLVKMSTYYPKYDDLGSLMECLDYETELEEDSANYMACALASARGKNAILRVGGGSFFDHAYRAVSVTWNQNPENANKYHLVGGGAGSVSAAGGWMASGGLSGTTGMRMYGIGIDQVLHLEMVLPSGTHVRFGPSEWDEAPGMITPQTTQVTGFCNYQWEMPEEDWEWTECTGDDADIDFDELWFAVRGGGGGTWGIVTSLHYQLHDYPGELYLMSNQPGIFAGYEELAADINAVYTLTLLYVRFALGFLYQPSSMNVTEAESRGCNSAKTFGLNPFVPTTLFCYGSSGPKLIEAWAEYISGDEQLAALTAAGAPDDFIAILPTLFQLPELTAPSYADFGIFSSSFDPLWNHQGRIPDNPKASLVPFIDGFPSLADSTNTHFPLRVVEEQFDALTELITIDTLYAGDGQLIYATGGAIPYADDGLNALSPTRRFAAFQKAVNNETTRSRYYELFYSDADMSAPFPGQACHNHAHVYEMGPLKDDWTRACSLDWPQATREELCIAQGENFWGTENLARLETFKDVIDPDGIFLCAAGIGYSNPAVEDETFDSEGSLGSFPKEESEDEEAVPDVAVARQESPGDGED